jgi:hypothetical protein
MGLLGNGSEGTALLQLLSGEIGRSSMNVFKKQRIWQLIYAVCCLVYVGWVSYQGSFDLTRVYRDYRRIGVQMEPGRIHAAAVEELSTECRKRAAKQKTAVPGPDTGLTSVMADQGCNSFPPAVVATRAAAIGEILAESYRRVSKKLLFFGVFFVVVFLIIPPVLVYGFAVVVVKVFQAIKIVRRE